MYVVSAKGDGTIRVRCERCNEGADYATAKVREQLGADTDITDVMQHAIEHFDQDHICPDLAEIYDRR